MNFTTFGGRRFFMTVGCGLVTSVLLWFAKLTPEAYAEILKWTVGVYIVGGTADNVKDYLTKKGE